MADIKFKDLTVDNLFDFCAVLDAVGVESIIGAFDKRELNAIMQHEKNLEKLGMVVMMKIIGIIIKNIPKAKNEICTFLAGCSELEDGTPVTEDDFKSMKVVPFIKLIKSFAEQEDLKDFFEEAVGSLNTERQNLKSL